MPGLDQLRSRQEQRISLALESWNEAKEQLKKAMAFAAAREREYREVSEDVRRRLDALELVSHMAREFGEEALILNRADASENLPRLTAPRSETEKSKAIEIATKLNPAQCIAPGPSALHVGVRKSSRPLFSSDVRSRLARLSILQ